MKKCPWWKHEHFRNYEVTNPMAYVSAHTIESSLFTYQSHESIYWVSAFLLWWPVSPLPQPNNVFKNNSDTLFFLKSHHLIGLLSDKNSLTTDGTKLRIMQVSSSANIYSLEILKFAVGARQSQKFGQWNQLLSIMPIRLRRL